MQPDQLKSIQLKKGKIAVNLKNNQYELITEVFENFYKFKITNSDQEFDLFWSNQQLPIEFYYKLKAYQKINFIPNIEQICRKNMLNSNIRMMQKKFPNQFDFYPQTFNLPVELRQFKAFMQQNQDKHFIIKPEQFSQGKGIQIIKNFEEIDQADGPYIGQVYIENPYLIDKLKWDLRLYVLIAGTDPLRIYLYKEGMARFATVPYQQPEKDNLNQQYMHLTNYAINKNNPNFQYNFNESLTSVGHKRSYTAIQEVFARKKIDESLLTKKIHNIIFNTISSIYIPMKYQTRKLFAHNLADDSCFQILGFDILIDQDVKPWLLEVNQSPSFSGDSPFDKKLKTCIIKDTINFMNIQSVKSRMNFQQQQQDNTINKIYKKSNRNSNQSDDFDQKKKKECDNRNQWIRENQGDYQDLITNEMLNSLKNFQAYQEPLYNKKITSQVQNTKQNNNMYNEQKEEKKIIQEPQYKEQLQIIKEINSSRVENENNISITNRDQKLKREIQSQNISLREQTKQQEVPQKQPIIKNFVQMKQFKNNNQKKITPQAQSNLQPQSFQQMLQINSSQQAQQIQQQLQNQQQNLIQIQQPFIKIQSQSKQQSIASQIQQSKSPQSLQSPRLKFQQQQRLMQQKQFQQQNYQKNQIIIQQSNQQTLHLQLQQQQLLQNQNLQKKQGTKDQNILNIQINTQKSKTHYSPTQNKQEKEQRQRIQISLSPQQLKNNSNDDIPKLRIKEQFGLIKKINQDYTKIKQDNQDAYFSNLNEIKIIELNKNRKNTNIKKRVYLKE